MVSTQGNNVFNYCDGFGNKTDLNIRETLIQLE